MKKKTEKSKNKLSLNLFEANLKRHPSVKCLFDEDGNMKKPKDSKDECLLLNIDNKSEKESNDTSNNNEENEENNEKKRTMSVKINRVQEKIVDNKETFYVEMDDKEMKEFINTKPNKEKVISKFSEPLNYEFNDNQKKFDKDITEAMSKGKEYHEIEGKFLNQLKK